MEAPPLGSDWAARSVGPRRGATRWSPSRVAAGDGPEH